MKKVVQKTLGQRLLGWMKQGVKVKELPQVDINLWHDLGAESGDHSGSGIIMHIKNVYGHDDANPNPSVVRPIKLRKQDVVDDFRDIEVGEVSPTLTTEPVEEAQNQEIAQAPKLRKRDGYDARKLKTEQGHKIQIEKYLETHPNLDDLYTEDKDLYNLLYSYARSMGLSIQDYVFLHDHEYNPTRLQSKQPEEKSPSETEEPKTPPSKNRVDSQKHNTEKRMRKVIKPLVNSQGFVTKAALVEAGLYASVCCQAHKRGLELRDYMKRRLKFNYIHGKSKLNLPNLPPKQAAQQQRHTTSKAKIKTPKMPVKATATLEATPETAPKKLENFADNIIIGEGKYIVVDNKIYVEKKQTESIVIGEGKFVIHDNKIFTELLSNN